MISHLPPDLLVPSKVISAPSDVHTIIINSAFNITFMVHLHKGGGVGFGGGWLGGGGVVVLSWRHVVC